MSSQERFPMFSLVCDAQSALAYTKTYIETELALAHPNAPERNPRPLANAYNLTRRLIEFGAISDLCPATGDDEEIAIILICFQGECLKNHLRARIDDLPNVRQSWWERLHRLMYRLNGLYIPHLQRAFDESWHENASYTGKEPGLPDAERDELLALATEACRLYIARGARRQALSPIDAPYHARHQLLVCLDEIANDLNLQWLKRGLDADVTRQSVFGPDKTFSLG